MPGVVCSSWWKYCRLSLLSCERFPLPVGVKGVIVCVFVYFIWLLAKYFMNHWVDFMKLSERNVWFDPQTSFSKSRKYPLILSANLHGEHSQGILVNSARKETVFSSQAGWEQSDITQTWGGTAFALWLWPLWLSL